MFISYQQNPDGVYNLMVLYELFGDIGRMQRDVDVTCLFPVITQKVIKLNDKMVPLKVI